MDHPPSNQDLHVIEGVWAHLRKKLHASAPIGIERREDFIKCLQGAVRTLNISGKNMLTEMCSGFQKRSREVLKHKSGRIDY